MKGTTKKYIESIKAPVKDNGDYQYKRFNKKSFNGLLTAIINDPSYSLPTAKVKGGKLADVEALPASLNFRKCMKKMVESMGVDKAESAKILTDEFQIKDSDGLYDVVTAAMIEYMDAGNAFDLPTTPEMKCTLKMRDIKGSTGEPTEAFHPKTRESLGQFKTTKKNHKVVKVSSTCPNFLKTKERV